MSKTLEREIKTIKANLNNDAIPDFAKEPLKKKLAELEEKLSTAGAKEVAAKIDKEKRSPKFKKDDWLSVDTKSQYFTKNKDFHIVNGGVVLQSRWSNDTSEGATYIYEIQPYGDNSGKATEPVWIFEKLLKKRSPLKVGETSGKKKSPTFKELTEKQAQKQSEKSKIVDWDCDELIEKEKAKLKKRKSAQKKRSNKSEPTKQRERVEKVTATVEKSIKERIKSGKSVSKKEVTSLIEMYEREITDLKKLLKTL